MCIDSARIGAVLNEKRSFRHNIAYFREKFLLVFEVEQGDLVTSMLTLLQIFLLKTNGQ
jgi:hypothetical protein